MAGKSAAYIKIRNHLEEEHGWTENYGVKYSTKSLTEYHNELHRKTEHVTPRWAKS